MANTTNQPSIDEREKGPLHRPPGAIDAGTSNTGNEDPIINPPRETHTVKPTPGNEAAGQTSKM
jgi:hypothetical protein